MNYSIYLFGPHLIGALFILIGLLQRFLPPKNINRWYGYRTLTARSSQQAWDEGNRYSAMYMIKAGAFVLIVGFAINVLAITYVTNFQTRQMIGYIMLFGGAMGIGILSTMATERHLKKTFKNLKVKPPVKKRK
jgi:uncharacterized membrane protein